MTFFTRLLLWLLSKRSDMSVNINHLEEQPLEDFDAIDYLEFCYGLDSAFLGDGSLHGGDQT